MSRAALVATALLALAATGCAGAVTTPPQSVTGTDADAGGEIFTTSGGQVEFWVEYGLTSDYGSETAHATRTLPADERRSVTGALTGLVPGTTYHYRICARDSQQGTTPSCGADRALTTQTVDCGGTVTTDMRLTAPMHCDERGGLEIGADGVDVNLGGYVLRGVPTVFVGILDEGYDDVTIRNGAIEEFGGGVRFEGANRSLVNGVTTSVGVSGGANNAVRHSEGRFDAFQTAGFVLADSRATSPPGGGPLRVIGDGALITRNEVNGTPGPPAISIAGSDNTVRDNEVTTGGTGVIRVESGAGNILRGNSVSGGVAAPGTDPGSIDEDDWMADGIYVSEAATGTLLRANNVFQNQGDGIKVRGPGARLRDNTSSNNFDFGIDALAGTIDLGGNIANLNGHSPQCRNVFCATGSTG